MVIYYTMDDKTAIIDWIYNKDQENFPFPFVYKNESGKDIRKYIQKCFEFFGIEQMSQQISNQNPLRPAIFLVIGKTLNEYEFYKNEEKIKDNNIDLIQELKINANKFIENDVSSIESINDKYEKLKDFFSTLAVMKCAIHYSSRDYMVETIKASSKRKTPDLQIEKKYINKVVEVKWLRPAEHVFDVETENRQLFDELKHIVNKNNIAIEILFNNHPYHTDFKPLTEEITNKIKSVEKIPYTFNLVGKKSGIDIKIKFKKGSNLKTNIPFFEECYRIKSDLEKAEEQIEIYKQFKGFMDMESCIVIFLHFDDFVINKGKKDYIENRVKIWLKNHNNISKILLFYEAPIFISNGVFSLNDNYSVV